MALTRDFNEEVLERVVLRAVLGNARLNTADLAIEGRRVLLAPRGGLLRAFVFALVVSSLARGGSPDRPGDRRVAQRLPGAGRPNGRETAMLGRGGRPVVAAVTVPPDSPVGAAFAGSAPLRWPYAERPGEERPETGSPPATHLGACRASGGFASPGAFSLPTGSARCAVENLDCRRRHTCRSPIRRRRGHPAALAAALRPLFR